jgi:hypothetical protein
MAESVSDDGTMDARLVEAYFLQAMTRKRAWYANVTSDAPLQVIPILLMNLL